MAFQGCLVSNRKKPDCPGVDRSIAVSVCGVRPRIWPGVPLPTQGNEDEEHSPAVADHHSKPSRGTRPRSLLSAWCSKGVWFCRLQGSEPTVGRISRQKSRIRSRENFFLDISFYRTHQTSLTSHSVKLKP